MLFVKECRAAQNARFCSGGYAMMSKKNSLKSFDPKLFYDEVPMVGLEPTWFPERF